MLRPYLFKKLKCYFFASFFATLFTPYQKVPFVYKRRIASDKTPRNDTGYVFDDIRYVVIARVLSEAISRFYNGELVAAVPRSAIIMTPFGITASLSCPLVVMASKSALNRYEKFSKNCIVTKQTKSVQIKKILYGNTIKGGETHDLYQKYTLPD
ncbi:MAG: hypothetical protein DCC43_05090 [Candidatus Brocadia sp.]|uniref:Uncharacterized protein n=1 Tax=Candidatus Brocadia fulgida TaxID=380242 RepID=A0A0M2UT27_9BACT|nr:MAG: hypothetical protein BROFUL_02091 [Candidatus Brocadia fulgida]MCE7910780.1 hypothetical protein [Candidatus Brocadia sp. AMX3]OQZ02039.1 MAG: hypothetical protein B6D35_01855 [Candidatus Brocadia sp. UTAMX2]RIK01849.1 MAG: hypothetical protein DCC43_05090 [Candidatus Brocadia sp.]